MAAIEEGRHAWDIWLITCPYDGTVNYWNQGQHCTCRRCGQDIGDQSDDACTLEDYWEYAPYPPDKRVKPGQ